MTAQPNDRAVEWLAEAMHDLTWQGRQTPPGRPRALAVTALAAIRDALARGGDDADAIAQAIGLPALLAWAKAEALREASRAVTDATPHQQGCRFPDVECDCGAMVFRALVALWLRRRADRIEADRA